MKEYRIKITYKDLVDLLKNGKTENKNLQVEEVEYLPEDEEYVTTKFLDCINFIEVSE